jgi:casein kinase I family protein HRR25
VLFQYARGLAFDDLPDYAGLRSLFRGLADRAGIEYDGVFDWILPTKGKMGPRRRASDGGVAASVHVGGGKRFCEACNARNNSGGVVGGRR